MLQRIYGVAFGSQGRPRRLPPPDRGGGEARPPQARPGDGPLPPAAGGAGVGVLAPERLRALAGARGLHPPPARRRRLRRGEDAAAPRRELWTQSGHWGKFRENMFVVPDEIPGTDEEADPVLSGKADLMALKPMNCPGHIQIFKQGTKSYRDLPLRMAEFGCCHRNEAHGALHGLLRVRQLTQDDAHIFCREDQIFAETKRFLDALRPGLRRHGHDRHRLQARDPARQPGPATTPTWDRAETALADALTAAGLKFDLAAGRGRLLRAEARVPPDRRHRPHLAVRHLPARLRAARALRGDLCRRGRGAAPAGDAAPGRPRHLRALHRPADRALRRPLPAVARPAAGGGRADRLRGQRLRRGGGGRAEGARASAPRPTSATRRSTTRSASTRSPRCR